MDMSAGLMLGLGIAKVINTCKWNIWHGLNKMNIFDDKKNWNFTVYIVLTFWTLCSASENCLHIG